METNPTSAEPQGQFIDSSFRPEALPKGFIIPKTFEVGRTASHQHHQHIQFKVLEWGMAQNEQGAERKPAFRVLPIDEKEELNARPYVIVYEDGMERDYTYLLTPEETRAQMRDQMDAWVDRGQRERISRINFKSP